MNYEKAWKELKRTINDRVEACESELEADDFDQKFFIMAMALWSTVYLIEKLEEDYMEEEA